VQLTSGFKPHFIIITHPVYKIPVISVSAIKQKRAARLIHISVALLLIGNAYGAFKSTANPDLIFIVAQIAISIMIFTKVVTGDKLYTNALLSHNLFRIGEIFCLLYATYYFSNNLHNNLMSFFTLLGACGLIYLVFSEQKIFKKQLIRMDEKSIQLPIGEGGKKIAWNQIDNLRIRNDYVSINTKQNRFIQFETNHFYNDNTLDEMNAWCFRHLTAETNLSKAE
jgi:hypothetical protein